MKAPKRVASLATRIIIPHHAAGFDGRSTEEAT
jgi:hypothetical protein